MPVRRSQMHSDKKLYIESIRSDANVSCQNQFIATTDRRMKSGKSQSLAKLINWTHDKNLQQKRERLRDVLSMEARLYQQELIIEHERKMKDEFKSRQNRLLGLKAERERQRLKFVEDMRVQQLVNNCDEIRPYFRQKLQDECKNCQQLQIEDNNLKRMEEFDRDRLWHCVQNQVFNQMTQRELEESLVAHSRNSKDQQILRKQMSDKKEVIKEVEYEEDTMSCGKVFSKLPSEEELFNQNKEKQIRLAKDLLIQQREKETAKTNLRNCELEHDLKLIDVAKTEIKTAEENARTDKRQNMKETLHYLDYRRNINNEKSMADREKNILIENMQNLKNKEYLRNRNYFDQQRNEFYKSIHDERMKQIIDRREKMLHEKNQKINEIIEANKIFANNSYMETELLRKKKNSRLQYGHELRAQCSYEKLEKGKAAASLNKSIQVINDEETKKNELIKNNLYRIHEIYPVHPMFKAIMDSKN